MNEKDDVEERDGEEESSALWMKEFDTKIGKMVTLQTGA